MRLHRHFFTIIGVVIFLLLAVSVATFYINKRDVVPSSSPFVGQVPSQPELQVMNQLPQLTSAKIQWEETKPDSYFFEGKILSGHSREGSLTLDEPYFGQFEDADELYKMGWQQHPTFDASGIDGGAWGYRKKVGEQEQVLLLSWKNQSLSLGDSGNIEAKCPCRVTLNVFLSDAF